MSILCWGSQCNTTQFPVLCNLCIGSFTAGLGPLIGYEDKVSLSDEGHRLTGLCNDLSIISYELVCCLFFLSHLILNCKKTMAASL